MSDNDSSENMFDILPTLPSPEKIRNPISLIAYLGASIIIIVGLTSNYTNSPWPGFVARAHDSERGIIEHAIQEDGTIAHSDWKKWYNSWLAHLNT